MIKNIIDTIKNTIKIEQIALAAQVDKINEQCEFAVELIYNCKGRLIVTGMGKAGIISRKIAATFSSTGTPAFFLHPAEALHGDLGIVTKDDLVLIFSNSGNTEEIIKLLPYFKRHKIKIISFTGNLDSILAKHSDIVIDVSVDKEAEPLGIAPTSSTTVMLAMGDALASALIVMRGFTKEEFSIFHPNGSLGKKLLLKVEDLMHTGEMIPKVYEYVNIREAIYEMSLKRFGVTFIVYNNDQFIGIFTDGDLRRLLQNEKNPLETCIADVMKKKPITINKELLAAEALKIMEDNKITVLPVINEYRKLVGILHMHDLIKSGII